MSTIKPTTNTAFSGKRLNIIFNGERQHTVNKTRISSLSRSVPHCTGGPSHFNKARKKGRHMDWKERNKTVFMNRKDNHVQNKKILRNLENKPLEKKRAR